VAFPSLPTLLTALAFSLPLTAAAEEPIEKNKTVQPNLELSIKIPPRVSINTVNRCPDPLIEVPRLPQIMQKWSPDDPDYQKIYNLFYGESSLDSQDDDLRAALLDQPLCTLPLQLKEKEPLTFFSGKDNSYDLQSAGSKAAVRLQAPGNFRYRIFGAERNRATNGILEYDINNKKFFFSGGTFNLPTLNLSTVVIGEIPLPSLIDELNRFNEAKEKLSVSLDQLVDNVERILGSRRIEAFLDWGSFFRDLLPKYTNQQGIIEPNNWQKVLNETSNKAEEFYHEKLTGHEREDLDLSIKSFQNDFNRLQDEIPLVRNAYQILNSQGQLCQVKWGGLNACNFYKVLQSLDDLVEITAKDGEITIKTADLLTNFYAHSSNHQRLEDKNGREWISSHLSRNLAKISGQAYFHAKLSEGVRWDELLPDKYKENLELLRLLLGQELNIIDVEAQLQAGFSFFYRSERMLGFQSSFNLNNQHQPRAGLLINIGTIYDNYSIGSSSFYGLADSHADLLLIDFSGSLTIEQFLRQRQELGLFFSSRDSPSPRWWYDANITASLEQVRKLTEFWGANFSYSSSYSGKVKQKAWSLAETKLFDAWSTLDLEKSLRGGFNVDWANMMLFSNFSKLHGAGFFANLPYLSLMGEYSVNNQVKTDLTLPLTSKLDIKEEKKHYLRKQQLAFKRLAGIESVVQQELRQHNLALAPGIYLEASLSQQLSGNFFSDSTYFSNNDDSTEIGLTLIENQLLSPQKSYLSIRYLGDAFNLFEQQDYQRHGAKLHLGASWIGLAVAYSTEKDKQLPSNTTTAEFSHTLYFGNVNITQFLELFPAAHAQPYYEITPKGKWRQQRDSDFRYLLQMQGQLDSLEHYAARKLSEIDLDTLKISLLGYVGQPSSIEPEASIGYNLGQINFYHQFKLSPYPFKKNRHSLTNEVQYDLYSGFGPLLLAESKASPTAEKFWLLPGFAFNKIVHLTDSHNQESQTHQLKSSLAFWPNEQFTGSFQLKYCYFKDRIISPYFNLELSSKFNLDSPQKLNILKLSERDLGSKLITSIGLKVGPLILAGSSQFSSEYSPREGRFGLQVSIDYGHFTAKK